MNRPLNSWDLLKCLALLLMFIDHAGAYVFLTEEWLRGIGRAAMPIFMFLTGYAAHYRYSRKLFLLGSILYVSEIFATGHYSPPNILFTILLCRALFAWLEMKGKTITRPFEWYAVCVTFFMSFAVIEYGTFALLFAICGYMKKNAHLYRKKQMKAFWALAFATHWAAEGLMRGADPLTWAIMAASLAFVGWVMWTGATEKIRTEGWPAGLARPLKFLSYHSAYVYVAHVIALQWLQSFGAFN